MLTTDDRRTAQRRLLRVMFKRGGKGFRILRSAEQPLRTYKRPGDRQPRSEGDIRGE